MSGIVLTVRDGSGPRSGFYGKLPARRDFVTGGLARAVTEPWHQWLEDGLVRSREMLGEGWLDAYLNQPVWRFVFAGGLCGEGALAGVMVPNLDKVGRHFPLMIAATLPARAVPALVPVALRDWYETAEALALSSLEAGFVVEEFERRVDALTARPPEAPPAKAEPTDDLSWSLGAGSPPKAWQWDGDDGGDPARVFARAFDRAVTAAFGPYSLWWSAGSDIVAPALLAHAGLPEAGAFAALLDGRWDERGWAAAPDFAQASSSDL